MMLRRPLSLILVLALGLASVTMAVARANAAGATQIILCSGYGVATVTLDADGNPTGPLHPCPDCLAGFGPALLATPFVVPDPAFASHRAAPQGMPTAIGLVRPVPQARGPPRVV